MAGRKSECKAGRQAERQAGRQAERQAGRKAERQAGRKAGHNIDLGVALHNNIRAGKIVVDIHMIVQVLYT